jgi:aspartate/methionine/tyrosine aminotransferase
MVGAEHHWIPPSVTAQRTAPPTILVTQGTGFNWPEPRHVRIAKLPWSRDLAAAIERLGNFLASYWQ